MLRVVDFHGLKLELVAFTALQDGSCVFSYQALTPTYNFIFSSWKKYGWKIQILQWCLRFYSLNLNWLDRLKISQEQWCIFFLVLKKTYWKPPPYAWKVSPQRGAQMFWGRRDSWSMGCSLKMERLTEWVGRFIATFEEGRKVFIHDLWFFKIK